MGAFGSSPFGWMGSMNPAQAAQSPFGNPSNQQLNQAAGSTQFGNPLNPLGFSNPQGALEGERNLNAQNLAGKAYSQRLAPMFAKSMFGAAGPAENFYGNLMNLGSPYYQQHQTASFGNALNDYSNAYAQASNQLRGQGLGYGPTGANVAMLGGMGQGFAQDAASQYLQNLFQNENLQMQGAQGLGQMASLFQPAPLLGGMPVSQLGTNPSWTSQFAQFAGGLGSLFGGGAQGAQAGYKIAGGG